VYSSIVDEYVDTAPGAGHALHCGVNLCRISYIRRDGEGVRSQIPLELGLIHLPGQHGYTVAAFGREPGGGQADAARPTGYYPTPTHGRACWD